MRDALTEQFFLATYGSPLLQALMGLSAEHVEPRRRIERDVAGEAMISRARAELESAVDRGGPVEAFVRALMYVVAPSGRVDERGYAALEEVGRMLPPDKRPGFARFKDVVRQQCLMLYLDEERAIEALPKLAASPADRRLVLESLQRLIAIRQAELSAEQQRRLSRIEGLVAVPAARRERATVEE
jgi:hypothetical protein